MRLRILGALVILFVYLAALFSNLHESERRSLRLHQETSSADRVLVAIKIVDLNINTGEIRARLRFQPVGKFAKDEVTPAVNLKLLLNCSSGPQEFEFPKDKRINPIEASFVLEGESNKYPFDSYASNFFLLMTTPTRTSPEPSKSKSRTKDTITSEPGDLIVGSTALTANEPVPLSTDVSASIPGIKFTGTISPGSGVTGIELNLRRARNVVFVSILVMAVMLCLSMFMLAMTLIEAKSSRGSDLSPLRYSIPLIFGLPALRNAQPGVPPLGALGDYFSFLWAEIIVAACAVFTIWIWLLTPHEKPQP